MTFSCAFMSERMCVTCWRPKNTNLQLFFFSLPILLSMWSVRNKISKYTNFTWAKIQIVHFPGKDWWVTCTIILPPNDKWFIVHTSASSPADVARSILSTWHTPANSTTPTTWLQPEVSRTRLRARAATTSSEQRSLLNRYLFWRTILMTSALDYKHIFCPFFIYEHLLTSKIVFSLSTCCSSTAFGCQENTS